MIKKIITFIMAVALGAMLCACGENNTNNNEKLKVTATLFPQYDFARIIGGERVQVTKLIPFGSESHTYDPSIKDITAVSGADMFIYTGEDMERWASSIIESAGHEDMLVLDLSENIELLCGTDDTDHTHGDDNGHAHDYDAHIWTNPKNAMIMADSILEAFCKEDAENADYYRENAAALKAELLLLDEQLLALSERYDGRTLYFGGRFAFLYMFDEYGFSYRSPYKGCGEESEPGIKAISEIVSEMKNDGTKYIFFEEMSEGKIAKSIAEETGAEMLILHSCHNLSASEAKNGQTYISLMKSNIENLELALGESGN